MPPLDHVHTPLDDPDTSPWFTPEVVEVVVSSDIKFGPLELPLGMRSLRLVETPYLSFGSTTSESSGSSPSRSRGSVYHRLRDLRIPNGLALGLSAVATKFAQPERSGRGMRLKWISLSYCTEDETLMLSYFPDVLTQVSGPRDPRA